MTDAASGIRKQFAQIGVWEKGDQRAPHKPLLLLLALARCQRGEDRRISYTEVERLLKPLLQEFGPPRNSHHPEYPFWYLKTDGVWELRGVEALRRREGKNVPRVTELRREGVTGGLPAELHRQLRRNPRLLVELAQALLDAHFPETLHGDIRSAVGLDLALGGAKRPARAPEFRVQVVNAYEHRCAVCNFHLKMEGKDIGLEAAHIMWHQASGPDVVPNGVAMCTLHHKLFDRGAFTLGDDLRVAVSKHAHGSAGFEDWLLRFNGAEIVRPADRAEWPAPEFIRWHRKQVFRSPARAT